MLRDKFQKRGRGEFTDATGFKKELIEYEPFGQESRHEKYGSSEEVAWYYFTGKKSDDESGLIYFGARYYDPKLGRFITADSVVQDPYDSQSLNRYSYTSNNPINRIDFDGHKWSWKKFWKAAVGAFIGVVAAIVTAGLSIGFSALAAQGFSAITAGAWAVGGAIGGAVTGGLEGGWRGALMGAAMGGALGGLGGWAAGLGNTLGNVILGSMLAGGIANAAINDSWDSFAGGLAGATAGSVVGMGAVRQYQARKAGNSNQYSSGVSTGGSTNSQADGNANKALVVDKGKGASGDPIIDDPSVRSQMLKALNDSNEKQLEWGGIVKRRSDGGYNVKMVGQDSRFPDKVAFADGRDIFRDVADFHTHWQHNNGPSTQDGLVSGTNMSTYGLKHYVVDNQGIKSFVGGPGDTVNWQHVWKWNGN